MAGLLKGLLGKIPIAYLATARKDGSPRVHPICPILAVGRMYVAVANAGREHPSPKRYDLRNDGRYAMHAMPGERDDEFYCVGRARQVADAGERGAVASAAGHTVHSGDDIFELALEVVMTAYWEHVGQPDTYAVRQLWRSP